jgi:hypothetical protein
MPDVVTSHLVSIAEASLLYLRDWYWKSAVQGYCSKSVLFPPQSFSALSIPHWSAGIRWAFGCDSHPEACRGCSLGLLSHTGCVYPPLTGEATGGFTECEFGQHTFGFLPSNPHWDCLRSSTDWGWRGFCLSRDSNCWHSCIGTHWPTQPPPL